MSLYPSLEDMQVHKMIQAQEQVSAQVYSQQLPAYTQSPYPDLYGGHQPIPSAPAHETATSALYPGLSDFMGLELSEEIIAINMPEYMKGYQVVPAGSITSTGMIAPLSNQTAGLQKAQVTHGIRELILCKDAEGKVGLRVKDINNGVFVTIVVKNSPAALAGLRFGDQILQINGTVVAGYSKDAIHKLLKKSPKNDISLVIRDRPFERTVTMHKDSLGHIGFQFNNGKITTIVKDSSAAKNGLLIDHQLLEVNGQNVVGMKDKEISAIISNASEPVITVTIIPSFIYDHMMKKMSTSFIRSLMDHSAPSDF